MRFAIARHLHSPRIGERTYGHAKPGAGHHVADTRLGGWPIPLPPMMLPVKLSFSNRLSHIPPPRTLAEPDRIVYMETDILDAFCSL